MNQVLKYLKKFPTLVLAFFALSLFLAACKKNGLAVDHEKTYIQADFKFNSSMPYNSGWQLILQPGGQADIVPGGDIVWRGSYKIKGRSLTVKTDQTSFGFEIISENELKEKQYGIVLKAK